MDNQALKDCFHFDGEGLAANRLGQITEKQKVMLLQADKTKRTLGTVAGILFGVIALIGLCGGLAVTLVPVGVGLTAGQNSQERIALGLGLGSLFGSSGGLGFGCVWPLVRGGLGFLFYKFTRSKFQVQLQRVEGPVDIVRELRPSHSRHPSQSYQVDVLHVGGQSLDVSGSLADILMQGEPCAFYYTEGSRRRILPAESISKAN
jgi:hypothetical protein